MYLCMDVSKCAYICACIHLWNSLIVCKYVCIHACMNIFMCVHFYVCIYMYLDWTTSQKLEWTTSRKLEWTTSRMLEWTTSRMLEWTRSRTGKLIIGKLSEFIGVCKICLISSIFDDDGRWLLIIGYYY